MLPIYNVNSSKSTFEKSCIVLHFANQYATHVFDALLEVLGGYSIFEEAWWDLEEDNSMLKHLF